MKLNTILDRLARAGFFIVLVIVFFETGNSITYAVLNRYAPSPQSYDISTSTWIAFTGSSEKVIVLSLASDGTAMFGEANYRVADGDTTYSEIATMPAHWDFIKKSLCVSLDNINNPICADTHFNESHQLLWGKQIFIPIPHNSQKPRAQKIDIHYV